MNSFRCVDVVFSFSLMDFWYEGVLVVGDGFFIIVDFGDMVLDIIVSFDNFKSSLFCCFSYVVVLRGIECIVLGDMCIVQIYFFFFLISLYL